MLILGIETSCDETSVAVVEDGCKICSVVTATQIDVHKLYGGVVPEIASRIHAESLREVSLSALDKAGAALEDISYIAVTSAPGLLGSLLVGVSFANALALSLGKPCLGINHLEAHIYSAFMEFPDLKPPVMALLVSGGHTVIVKMEDFGKFQTLGCTLDDAAGEAFDKIAFYLGLGYPGGPAIQKTGAKGDSQAFHFPRAMLGHERRFDFSFSGLKTSVMNKVRRLAPDGQDLGEQVICDIAASFQEAVVDALVIKTVKAAEEQGIAQIILAGGVAANSRLREKMRNLCDSKGFQVRWPSLSLCGDNAAMVAGVAFHKLTAAAPFVQDVSAVKPL